MGFSDYKIREIQNKDNSIIADIIRGTLKKYNLDIPGTAYFDASLDNLYDYYYPFTDKGYYVITDSNDNVVGGIGFEKAIYFENTAELQKLYLAESVRGMGLSYSLIDFIENKMKQSGYNSSYLETHSNLTEAIHLYKKCGYCEIECPKEIVHSAMNMFFYKKLD